LRAAEAAAREEAERECGTEEMEALRRELEGALGRIATLEQELLDQREDFESQKSAAAQLVLEMEADQEKAENSMVELQAALDSAKAQLASRDAETAEGGEDAALDLLAAKKTIADLQFKLESLEDECDGEHDRLQAALKAAEDKVSTAEAKRGKAKEQTVRLEARAEELEGKCTALKSQRNELNTALAALRSERDSLADQLESYKVSTTSAAIQTASEKICKDILATIGDVADLDMEQLTLLAVTAKMELAQAEERLLHVQHSMSSLRAVNRALESKVMSMADEVEDTKVPSAETPERRPSLGASSKLGSIVSRIKLKRSVSTPGPS